MLYCHVLHTFTTPITSTLPSHNVFQTRYSTLLIFHVTYIYNNGALGNDKRQSESVCSLSCCTPVSHCRYFTHTHTLNGNSCKRMGSFIFLWIFLTATTDIFHNRTSDDGLDTLLLRLLTIPTLTNLKAKLHSLPRSQKFTNHTLKGLMCDYNTSLHIHKTLIWFVYTSDERR